MPWVTTYVLGYCGDCEWARREESPDQGLVGRVALAAVLHRERTGHNAVAERGQAWQSKHEGSLSEAAAGRSDVRSRGRNGV